MFSQLRPAVVMLATMIFITGLLYPLAITGLAQIIAPGAANGSLVAMDGRPVGSSLIGQAWTSDKYFHGRPSAAGSAYDALASGGSNLGPTSRKLRDRIVAGIASVRPEFGANLVSGDAVTASGSGLDPDISPEYALAQVARVAKARGLQETKVKAAVDNAIERPVAGLFGEPRVNVLLLNMALDRLSLGGNG